MNIEVIKKPEYISLEQITEVLHEAHETTAVGGMHFWAHTQTVEDTRKRLGNSGEFFVALCDGDLAGCAAVIFHQHGKKWYCKNKDYAEIKMVAVRNKYKGLGLSNMLYSALEKRAFERNDLIVMNTASANELVIGRNIRHGWKIIDYCSWRNTDYYSVVMGKWKKCPYSDLHLKGRYKIRKLLVTAFKDSKGHYRIPFFSK